MHTAPTKDKPSSFEERRRRERARIDALLTVANLKLTEIDAAYRLPAGTASNAMAEPHVAGERAIAAALGLRPHNLWRTRYHASGERLRPQPAENYRHGRRQTAEREAA